MCSSLYLVYSCGYIGDGEGGDGVNRRDDILLDNVDTLNQCLLCKAAAVLCKLQ